MTLYIMRMLLRYGPKANFACLAWKSDIFMLELINNFLLESFIELKLLQSLSLRLLLLIVLLLKPLVLRCVAMFCVKFLALKTFTADFTLELISVNEALCLRVRLWRRNELIKVLLLDFFLDFNRLLLHALPQCALSILSIGLQLLTLENMLLPQPFLL